MRYAMEADHARHCAKVAMDHMDARDIAPTPDNFELWFAYALGANRELVGALDDLAARGAPFSEADLGALHDRFFNGGKISDAVMEVGDKMQAELGRVLEFVETAGRDSSTYGTALAHASGQIGRNGDGSPLTVMLDTLLKATRHMQARTQTLEQELQKSSSEINQLKDNLDTIHKETLTDQLTGLMNRRGFDDRMKRCLLNAEHARGTLALILADIDHFKQVNDRFGHLTGDQILRLTARCLQDSVKQSDIAARYGGEEFAVILPASDLPMAAAVAEQIRKAVESKKVVKRSTGESLGTVTVSLGVAAYETDDTVESLIERADQCLYAAKRAGRNQVVSDLESVPPEARPADEAAV